MSERDQHVTAALRLRFGSHGRLIVHALPYGSLSIWEWARRVAKTAEPLPAG